MKPKDATKQEIVELVKFETYPEENILPKDGLYRYLFSLVKNMEVKRNDLLTDFI